MKIYGHPLSSCTRKVLMLLAEKGRDTDFEIVDLFAHAQRSPEHLARHPFGVVPVLVDGDFVLYESRAILRYLDARCDGDSLTPKGARAVARMNQWLSVDQSYVAPHTRSLAIERLLRKREGLEPRADIVDAAEKALATAFETIDCALAGSTWLAGDAISLADLSLTPYVASLPMIGAAHTIANRPHLAGWWERVSARPSWKSVIARALP